MRRLPYVLLVAPLVAACAGAPRVTPPADTGGLSPAEFERRQQTGTITGGDIVLFGRRDRPGQEEGGSGIGVNSFLWRASLDTVSFMPVVSADPFGGTIITDWYSPPDQPGERFKVNVFILGRTLRSDGVRVSVFRQVRDGAAGWRDVDVGRETATQLENSILARAREFRNASAVSGRL